MQSENDSTRKRKDISSVSELDTSAGPPAVSKKTKKKKKKEEAETEDPYKMDIGKQLADINKKLSNVLTKDDGVMRTLIKEIFQQLMDDFLHSVNNRIEILEGRLFERDQENDELNKTVKDLNTTVEGLNKSIESLKKQTESK